MKKLLLFLTVLGLIAAGMGTAAYDRTRAWAGEAREAVSGAVSGVLREDPVASARKKVEALKENAARWGEKSRLLEIEAEKRELRLERLDHSLSEIRSTIRSFVGAAKQAQASCRKEFTFNGRRYRTEDAERQVAVWCAAEKKAVDRAQVESRARDMYRAAAEKIHHQIAVVEEARFALAGKVDGLESRRDLLRVEAEIKAVQGTLAGFNRGEVGQAMAALESEIEDLSAAISVDTGGKSSLTGIEEALADFSRASADEAVEDLAQAYWR